MIGVVGTARCHPQHPRDQTRRRPGPSGVVYGMTEYRPPYREGALLGLAIFGLYVLTLSPTTAWWDASEYITTGHLLGIPHPPGNPLFVSLARVWSLLLAPLGLPVAVRINLLAAATSSAATFFFFLVGHRVLSTVIEERWMLTIGAACGAVMGATAYTVWNQSTANEKVYTVSVAVIAAVSWLAIRWYDQRGEPAGVRALLAALYLMVLGASNHLMSVLPAPALALFVLLAGPAVLLSSRFWIRAIPLVILGISFNFFLPIRAAQDPIINEGNPVCESVPSAVVAVYTNGGGGCPALASNLSRAQYAKPPLSERQAPLRYQFLNYFQYFDWQWARGAELSVVPSGVGYLGARLAPTILFMAMGFMGLLVLWRADRMIFTYVAALTATLTVGLVVYLNFKLGFSLAPDVADRTLHEVRERDYFFVASFIVWGNLAGIGLAGFWAALANQWGEAAAYRKWMPILLITFIPLAYNWGWASRSGDYAAFDWAYDLLMSVEPYGVLFTNGDNDTFPLWYAQEIEGVRKDVTVIVLQYLYTDWYPRQIRDRTAPGRQRPFDEQFAAGIYSTGAPPDQAVSLATDEVLNAVTAGTLPEDLSLLLDSVLVTYPSGTYMDRAVRIALSMIQNSAELRPIYFASSAGLLQSLGLERFGVRHGLATKLVMRDLGADPPEGWIQGTAQMGAEWFDLERNLTLVQDVYRYRGIKDREIWQDRSTLSIPTQFQFLFILLADAAVVGLRPVEEISQLTEDAASTRITALGGRRYVEAP